MENRKKNFSVRLQFLLRTVGLKNATLAKAVQYDLSYISKWLGGKMLPSEKNIEEVLGKIAACIEINDVEKKLLEEYECPIEELNGKIYQDLLLAWKASRTNMKAEDKVLPVVTCTEVVEILCKKVLAADSVVGLLDIMMLPHDDRLALAGIRDGSFIQIANTTKYVMIVCLKSEDCVYDSVFLIHLLTSFSGIDFYLYNNKMAEGKIVYYIDGMAYTAVYIPGNNHCLAYTMIANGVEVGRELNALFNQENLIFWKTTISDMILNRSYVQSMISTNIKWLLGHATELLIPQEVFEDFIIETRFEKECRMSYQLSQSILHQTHVCILIYESAISNLVVDRTIDFYNEPKKLNDEQLHKSLDYYISLIDMGAQVKLIQGGFFDDFKHITNPCMLLSDTVSYLRLENGRYKDNIMLLKDREVKELFDSFFEKVWSERSDVVIEDREAVLSRIKHYREAVEMLRSS